MRCEAGSSMSWHEAQELGTKRKHARREKEEGERLCGEGEGGGGEEVCVCPTRASSCSIEESRSGSGAREVERVR